MCDVESVILETTRSFPCVMICGSSSETSALAEKLFAGSFRFVSLEDSSACRLAASAPKLFLERHNWPLIIEEIQKAPGLVDEIKIRIDRQRLAWLRSGEPRRLMYVLICSDYAALEKSSCDSLAGRCGIVDVSSFKNPGQDRGD